MDKVQTTGQHSKPGITAAASENKMEKIQLYAGAWTEEEMEYTTALIQDFRDGVIEGIKDKATMRNFLAKKLGCITKRISKKFEKSGYNGRLQYESGVAGLEAEEVMERQEQLRGLEKKFRESRESILRLRGQSHATATTTSSGPLIRRGCASSRRAAVKPLGVRDQSHLLPHQDQGSSISSIIKSQPPSTLNPVPAGLAGSAAAPALRGTPAPAGVASQGISAKEIILRGMLQQQSMMQRDIIGASSTASALRNVPSSLGMSPMLGLPGEMPVTRSYFGLRPVTAAGGYPTLAAATLLGGGAISHGAAPVSTSLLHGLPLNQQAITDRPLLQSLWQQQQQQQNALVTEQMMMQRKRELASHDDNEVLAQSAAANKRPRTLP